MKLVIVESPAKAKTIQKYLGGDFVVKSSFGHVRDLPKSKLGVDVEHHYEPHYIIPLKARKVVTELKKTAAKADEIYFATDEDREGEAIAWHLLNVLKPDKSKVKRITFTEITKNAIQKAVENPRQLDTHLVDAQQARRVLDRLVGYELSPLLWKKIRRGLSAGRVQSVAVRLIVEREAAIAAFKAEEYWTLTAHFTKAGQTFTAELIQHGTTRLKKLDLKTKDQVEEMVKDLTNATYTVAGIKTSERQKTPPPPFTTSTLQQAAVNTLGFSSKKTMMLAQQLYEGVELGHHGPVGLITYMRTDSVNLSSEATQRAHGVITQHFGPAYALSAPRVFTKKAKGAQEAHEAIRPTDAGMMPDEVASHVTTDQLKVYRLIWQRFMASQMAAARLQTVAADITTGEYVFRATGSTVLFDGYTKVFSKPVDDQEKILPPLDEDEQLPLDKLLPEQHFTQPPARYSEASLVKILEEKGIGRPSTYAPTIDTVQRREYVVKGEDKRFKPTEIGTLVNSLLTAHFPKIVDVDFTASMENDLDKIARGEKVWQPVIDAFYKPFHEDIKKTESSVSKSELTQEKTGETCPECGGEIIIKLGRFGKFKACSNYPKCKHTEPIGEDKKIQTEHANETCPTCGKHLVVKHGRFGVFLGCSGYPECKFIKKIEKSTGVTCPACGQGEIIEKRSRKGKTFYACNRYPDCKNAYWSKPNGEKCPVCGSLLVFGAKNTIRCSSKDCTFSKEAEATTQEALA